MSETVNADDGSLMAVGQNTIQESFNVTSKDCGLKMFSEDHTTTSYGPETLKKNNKNSFNNETYKEGDQIYTCEKIDRVYGKLVLNWERLART